MDACFKSALRNGNKPNVILIVFLRRNLLKLYQLIIIVDLPFSCFFASCSLLLLFTANIIIQRCNQFDFYTYSNAHSLNHFARSHGTLWNWIRVDAEHTSKLLWLYRLERHERWKSTEIDFDASNRCKSSEEAGKENGQSNKCSFGMHMAKMM